MGCSPTHDESATRSKDHENHSPKSNSKVVERRERFELASRHRRLRPVLFMQCYGGKKVNTQLTARRREQVIAAIQALDLDPIKFKLMDHEEGQGWSREYVDQISIDYKGFLPLSVKDPRDAHAPS